MPQPKSTIPAAAKAMAGRPKGWKFERFDRYIALEYGSGLPKSKRLNGGNPVFGSNGIVDYHNDYLVKGPGIIVGRKGTIGAIKWVDKNFWPIDTTYYAQPKKDILLRWLYYKLQDLHLEKLNTASGTPGLNRDEVYCLKIGIPSKSEQQKIADVLSSVDAEIEAVEKEIKTTERLKRGLMQDLLTRGIGHKKFKKTGLGEIPVEWEVVKIKDSGIKLVDGDRGVNYPKRSYFSSRGHCLFLSNQNIKGDRFVFDVCNFISKENDEKLSKGKLERGDVVLTTRGTVGTVGYYDESVLYDHIRINSGMLIFRHGKDYYPEFLYKLLASPKMKLVYKDMGSGSAQPQLPMVNLRQIKIIQPPKPEQKKIAEILSSVDNKLLISKQLKQKLILLKKGLMRDLLSGRVRVNLTK